MYNHSNSSTRCEETAKTNPISPINQLALLATNTGDAPALMGKLVYLLFPPTGQKHGLRSWHSSLQGPAAFVAHRVKPLFATLAFHI